MLEPACHPPGRAWAKRLREKRKRGGESVIGTRHLTTASREEGGGERRSYHLASGFPIPGVDNAPISAIQMHKGKKKKRGGTYFTHKINDFLLLVACRKEGGKEYDPPQLSFWRRFICYSARRKAITERKRKRGGGKSADVHRLIASPLKDLFSWRPCLLFRDTEEKKKGRREGVYSFDAAHLSPQYSRKNGLRKPGLIAGFVVLKEAEGERKKKKRGKKKREKENRPLVRLTFTSSEDPSACVMISASYPE